MGNKAHYDANRERILAEHKVYYIENKEAILARNKAYRESHWDEIKSQRAMHHQDNKEEIQARRILRIYGLPRSVHQALVAKGCAICGSKENLHIDHDHTCCPGKGSCGECVRGVLCADHNLGLGRFHDDPVMLGRAIAYLEGQL